MSRLRKGGGERLAMPAIVVLVGLAAFGLGRLSVVLTPSRQATPTPHSYVGSKSGSVYYLPTCKGADAIREENRVWFVSTNEAEAAGYKPAANCAGM